MSWDTWTPDHKKLVSTLEELRAHFDNDDERLAHFMALPAARPMPDALRAEVKDYFGTPRWMPSDTFYRALAFAVGLHAGKSRKNPTRDPYFVHLFAVTALVAEDGGSEDECVAALLHDAAEDRPFPSGDPSGGLRRLAQVRADFGENVARIVEGCSEKLEGREGRDWKERKQEYVDRLRDEPADVRRVSLADKLHNARSLVTDLEQGRGFGLFNAKAEDQVWYYGELRKAFDESGTVSRHLPEFRRCVAQIVGHVESRSVPPESEMSRDE